MINPSDKFVLGVDFGTDSVRAILVNAGTGEVLSSSIDFYKRWAENKYCDNSMNQFRQHPLDFVESLEAVVTECLSQVEEKVRNKVVGISVATTGSTPAPVNQEGIPLALLEGFEENPNAMFILWKDHTATQEAHEINRLSDKHNQFLKYIGGKYSSEWYWAKLLHILRVDERVRNHCYSMVEHSDWIPFLLTGGKNMKEMKRNICAAGHKGLWVEELGGLPDKSFFEDLDPILIPFASRFADRVYAADEPAGNLSKEWAERLGLSEDVVVGIGALDAHIGAVGGGIQPFYITKVIGTSTCDMMILPQDEFEDVFIEGISGQVDSSIIPGMIGLEAGQSAFGDIYSWFRDFLLWPILHFREKHEEVFNMDNRSIEKIKSSLLKELDKEAAALPLSEDEEYAFDWFNGRRTPNPNLSLKGLIGGLTLGSNPIRVYKALVEATCFGSHAIVESIEKQGVEIRGVNALGGIPIKSEYVVQTLADVLNRPVHIIQTDQPVALGAAMFASVVAKVYPDVLIASERLKKKDQKTIFPRSEWVKSYADKYSKYQQIGSIQEVGLF